MTDVEDKLREDTSFVGNGWSALSKEYPAESYFDLANYLVHIRQLFAAS